MTWNFFQDVQRLKIFNAILLTEQTLNYSVLERLKYLNKNFLTEFKNHIKRSNEFENKHTEEDQNLSIAAWA